jgi:hypothetical protein
MTVEEIISITIYQSLREKLVVDGWLPDIVNYDIENEAIEIAETAMRMYNDALTAIKNNKGFAIELFPYSSNQARGYKKVPRIVVDLLEFLPGEIGNDTSVNYTKVEGESYYTRKQDVGMLSELYFMVYAVSNDVSQLAIMNELIMTVLPIRGYIKRYPDATLREYNNLFVDLIDKGKNTDLEEGVIERYYKYKIPDIAEIGPLVIEGNVPAINQINIDEIDLEIKPD